MRLHIIAVGFGRGTQEGALAEDFVGRAAQMGKRMGISAVSCEEIAVSKERDVKKRMADEASGWRSACRTARISSCSTPRARA